MYIDKLIDKYKLHHYHILDLTVWIRSHSVLYILAGARGRYNGSSLEKICVAAVAATHRVRWVGLNMTYG